MQEREISLVDLLIDILLKWRIIIAALVLGGVLGGVFGYIQFVKAADEQSLTNEVLDQTYFSPILQELENGLSDLQKNNVKAVLDYDKFGRYYQESVLMQIDASSVPTSEIVYQVVASDEVIANRLGRAYKETLGTGIVEWLVNNGMDAKEASKMRELIKIEENANDNQQENTQGSIPNKITDEAYIRVKVLHMEEEACRQLTQSVKDYLAEEKKIIEKTIGSHELQLIKQDFAVVADSELTELQRNMVIAVTEGNQEAVAMRRNFSDEEKQYYTYMSLIIEQEVTGESQMVDVGSYSPLNNPYYIVLGMLVSVFVYVFGFFIAYIFSGKLRINDNFASGTGITVLGRVACNKKYKGFDKWINSLRNGKKKVVSKEDVIGLTAIGMHLVAAENQVNKIACISSDLTESDSELVKEIQSKLKEKDIVLSVAENVLYSSKELETVQDEKVVFLVGKAGKTPYEDIIREAKFFERQNVIVAGVLIIE